jgi:16S rRNA processing protein RimM
MSPKTTQSWKVSEIAGSDVFEKTGEYLGKLVDVLPTNANDILVVRKEGSGSKEILIPSLKNIVVEVDTAAKKVIVDLPAGLKDIYSGQ